MVCVRVAPHRSFLVLGEPVGEEAADASLTEVDRPRFAACRLGGAKRETAVSPAAVRAWRRVCLAVELHQLLADNQEAPLEVDV
jgi:hypothetical protein